MNRKKIIFAVLLVFGISIASAQYVNDYNVNIRSEPSLDKNNKIGQLTKDDKISVYLVTNQTMKIGSSEYPWMYISSYETDLKGWIYGEYVSGQRF